MSLSSHLQTRFTVSGGMRGARMMAPVSLFVIPFGMSFGAAALSQGLDPHDVILMSVIVFAGVAQFAALDFWGPDLPLLAIALTVLAVNARHLVLGAALSPWLLQVSPSRRFLTLGLLTDVNFAQAMAAKDAGETDAGFLLGGGLMLWAAWVCGTALGVLVGSGIDDVATYGLDVLMVAYFAPIAVQFWEGRANLLPWAAAAGIAATGSLLLPAGWPIIAGALAGGLVGALRDAD